MCVVHDTLLWNAIATADAEEQICNAKSASGHYSRGALQIRRGDIFCVVS
jgi:hypothetical protein